VKPTGIVTGVGTWPATRAFSCPSCQYERAALADMLAYKFGYHDQDRRYRSTGTPPRPTGSAWPIPGYSEHRCATLLVINGMEDSIFPIEGSIIAATRGDDKDLSHGDPDLNSAALLLGWAWGGK
jgi:hypothetical protein